MAGPATKLTYEDFEPYCKWQREEGQDTLEVHLHGFRKDQMRIQLSNLGILTITGENRIDGNRWTRFRKEIRVSKDSKPNEIHARYSGGILYVIMPKKTPLLPPSYQDKPASLPSQEQETEPKTTDSADHAALQPAMPTSYTDRLKESLLKLKLQKDSAINVAVAVAVLVALVAFILNKFPRPSLAELITCGLDNI